MVGFTETCLFEVVSFLLGWLGGTFVIFRGGGVEILQTTWEITKHEKKHVNSRISYTCLADAGVFLSTVREYYSLGFLIRNL